MPMQSETSNTTNGKHVNIKFKTPDTEPPVINALTKLTFSERNDMLQKLYLKAKRNIIENYPTEMNQEKINELIREECNNLLNEYIETH
jgi:hypothetical protein